MALAPDVSVIVPCHAAASTARDLLEALAQQTLAPDRFEILLVDAGIDGTTRSLERAAADWKGALLRVLRAPPHGGPAVKRNLAAKAARGRLLAFTDADCLPEPAWLSAGLAAFEEGAQLIQGRTLPPDGESRPLLSHGIHIERDVGLHETCNFFYERRLFDLLGGFSAHYFRRFGAPFGEDAELGWRARRQGATFVFEPRAVVRHPVRPLTLVGHLREQWLGRAFPALTRAAPELRDSLFYRRFFLSRRSACFTAAVAGGLLWRRTPAAAVLAIPYARLMASELRPRTAALRILSDATLGLGLASGSARWRRLVL